MKGVILAGGTGTRLFPSTKVVNKHLLPVYDRPMIYYPIETLTKSGITDILIVSSRENMAQFMELLGSGSEVGASITYRVQEGASGIAQALSLAEYFVAGDKFALILGDNIFTENFSDEVRSFESGARVFLKEVSDPRRFGVAEISGKKVISLEEKPIRPKSSYAVTGLYFYDSHAFEFLKKLTPSERGELEITDLNICYMDSGLLSACFLKGAWADAGTHDSILEASIMLRNTAKPEALKADNIGIGIPEVTVGILAYQTPSYNCEKYLTACFDSLIRQDYANVRIIVLDNGSEDVTFLEQFKSRYPEITFLKSEKNLGFGGGHNYIIRQSDSPFYTALNFDMLFEPDFISKLMSGILSAHDLGSVTGKLKRWDFSLFEKAKKENNQHETGKTNFIDSVGLRIRTSHRFEDRGQGEVDYGQYNEREEIFGASGAAALYRRVALDNVAFVNDKGEKEYFDELFFMYKEDIDLAYRLQWAGWRSRYIPDAIAYHDRTVSQKGSGLWNIVKNRSHKSRRVNEWSFVNQEIILRKHFLDQNFSSQVKAATRWYNFKSFVYILLFEPHLLRQYRRLSDMSDQIEKRVVRMPRQTSIARIESLMED